MDLEDPRYWAGATAVAVLGLAFALAGRIPALLGVVAIVPFLVGFSAYGQRRRAERLAGRPAKKQPDRRRLPARWAHVETAGLRGRATLAVLAVMLVAVAAYLPLLSITEGDQFVIAPIALFANVAAVYSTRPPWWWVLPLSVTGVGAVLIGIVFPFEHGLLVWLASCALGVVVGAGCWLVALGTAQSPAGASPVRRDGPDEMAPGPVRAWAISYGVPADVLDLEHERPDDLSTYAVERRGERWRLLQPLGPSDAERRHGRWRRSREQVLSELCSELAYRYR